MLKPIVVVSCAAFLVGCATTGTFTPKSLINEPVEKLALVQAASENDHKVLQGLNKELYIKYINGKSTYTLSNGYAQSAYVAAGKNKLDLEFIQGFLSVSSLACLQFDAVAGEKYTVNQDVSVLKNYARFWIVKDSSQETVSENCDK